MTASLEAEALLRKAIALDPTYADALAALAECLVRMTLNGWVDGQTRRALTEACDLAGRAVAADPENAAVLAVAAWAYSTLGVRFEQSLELANRALALHPNSVHVRSFCGWVFNYFGDNLRAIEQFDEARRLSPVDPKSYFPMLGLAAAHFFAGHFDETVSFTGRILAEVPTHNIARRYRAAALGHLGRIDEAKGRDRRPFEGATELEPAEAPEAAAFEILGGASSTSKDWRRPDCLNERQAPAASFAMTVAPGASQARDIARDSRDLLGRNGVHQIGHARVVVAGAICGIPSSSCQDNRAPGPLGGERTNRPGTARDDSSCRRPT